MLHPKNLQTDRYGQNRTEPDQTGQKRTETDRNGQKRREKDLNAQKCTEKKQTVGGREHKKTCNKRFQQRGHTTYNTRHPEILSPDL